MIRIFRPKHCDIEAIQYTGNNANEIIVWAYDYTNKVEDNPPVFLKNRKLIYNGNCRNTEVVLKGEFICKTSDGFKHHSETWMNKLYQEVPYD